MESGAIEAVTLSGSIAAQDLSIWSLVWQADPVVKAVIVVLVVASIWCWAIIFDKALTLRRLNSRASQFEDTFWSGSALDDLYDRLADRPPDPMSAVFVAAMREWRRSDARPSENGLSAAINLESRLERVMQLTLTRETGRLERQMTMLASTGATAPFIGLFGTVWGIMHSFQAIGVTGSTSLAVVAPGIAEALFATALGLLAAIPAVIAYNKLSRSIDQYAGRVDGFAGEFLAILARHSGKDKD